MRKFVHVDAGTAIKINTDSIAIATTDDLRIIGPLLLLGDSDDGPSAIEQT
jgi:hypothetical protein